MRDQKYAFLLGYIGLNRQGSDPCDLQKDLSKHEKKCEVQSSSSKNVTASTSEIQFVDCGETLKQEIKEESDTADEINTVEDPLTVNSELCQDIVVSNEISLESEVEAESIDCKETIKLEIKQEIKETEDLQDPLSTEDIELDVLESCAVDEKLIEEFKIETNYDDIE